MKHAYLIIAHNEFEVLKALVGVLDDERNDIYVHFDAKVEGLPQLSVSRSKLYFTEKRVDVRWADYSMVEAELTLFKEACSKGENYAYLHLLSGVDMPLKSQDYIHDFFDLNQGKEFIDYCLYDVDEEMRRKMQRWHLFPSDFKNQGRLSLLKRTARAFFVRAQMLAGYKRSKGTLFKKGSQWVSLTQGFVEYLLEREADIKQMFTHTFCPDEVVWQTLCWDSPFRTRLYDVSLSYKGHMRLIDWERGRPYVWRQEDWKELLASDRLFARKFSGRHMDIVRKLSEFVTSEDAKPK